MPDGNKVPVEASLIARVTGAWKALTGKGAVIDDGTAWFGPLTPPVPTIPEQQQGTVIGRQFDFPAGVNIRLQPRNTESVTFQQMRALADNCDILRLVIETRKDQISKMKYSFKPKDEKKQPDARCKELADFFAFPDGENNWDDWLRQLMEELLVTDAATVYPWLTNDGTPYRMELMDGATIKRVVSVLGRTPAPPDVAYQQVLKGITAVDYTADELIYRPRNKRVHKIYGYSPVEQVIMTVNIAIRRAVHQLQYYTEGSTPDLLFQVPPEWNMAQIKEFNDYWQDQLSGNTAGRRRAQFLPHGVAPINTKDAVLKDPYDEWLARVICYCFSVSPQPFVKEQNKATAETAQEAALEEGLYPIMLWIKGLVDLIVWKYFKYTDLEFSWQDENATDPAQQNKMDDTSVKNGTATINEIRARRGDKPVEGGDVPMVLTASGYVPITANIGPKEPPQPAASAHAAPTAAQGATPVAPKPGAKEDNQEPPEEPEPAAKIAKAAKVPRIDRDSAAHKKIRQDLTSELSAFFKQQGKVIAHAVANKVGKADTDPLADIDFDGWDKLQDLFGTQLVHAAQNGTKDAYAQINMDDPSTLDLANQNAVDWAGDRAAELVGKRKLDDGSVVDNPNAAYSITDATREMLRSDVQTAMEQGLSNDDLASLLQENYAFSDARAETIARTETAFADCQGNLLLYQASGQVDSKQWIVGDGCCDECEALRDEIVPLDDSFSNGVDAPPAHPDCRCDYIPILSEDQGNQNSD